MFEQKRQDRISEPFLNHFGNLILKKGFSEAVLRSELEKYEFIIFKYTSKISGNAHWQIFKKLKRKSYCLNVLNNFLSLLN